MSVMSTLIFVRVHRCPVPKCDGNNYSSSSHIMARSGSRATRLIVFLPACGFHCKPARDRKGPSGHASAFKRKKNRYFTAFESSEVIWKVTPETFVAAPWRSSEGGG